VQSPAAGANAQGPEEAGHQTSQRVGLMILAIAVLLTTSFPLQTEINVTDASSRGCPLSLLGTITTIDSGPEVPFRYSWKIAASVRNSSTKDILLAVIKIQIDDPGKLRNDYTRDNDYFFMSDVFRSNTTQSIDQPLMRFGTSAKFQVRKITPTAIARVSFIQFSDGSTWGRNSEGREILKERQLTLNKLLDLDRVFRTEGPDKFVVKLMEPTRLTLIEDLQRLYKEKGDDVNPVAKEISLMLTNAERNQKAMTHKLDSKRRLEPNGFP